MTENGSGPTWGGFAEMGPLAAALAKAQAAYPPIPRDKRVTVTSKRTGQTYSFNYAPLDTILDKVRKPLADNGLAIVQLLDGPDLVTLLLHESGATLSGRINLPRDPNGDVQSLGSAITYLRRYALQAMLGIAAEEDDDGNAAAGNRATPTKRGATAAENLVGRPQPDAEPAFDPITATYDSGLIGLAEIGKSDADFQLRQVSTPDRPRPFPRIAFRLTEGRRGIKVEAIDAFAELIHEYRAGIEGFRVTCWGHLRDETFTPKKADGTPAKAITYQILTLSRLKVGQLDLTAPDEPEAPDLVAAATELFPDAVMA